MIKLHMYKYMEREIFWIMCLHLMTLYVLTDTYFPSSHNATFLLWYIAINILNVGFSNVDNILSLPSQYIIVRCRIF